MFSVLILPEAKRDIKKAANWYHSKENGLGKLFIQSIRDESEVLQSQPFAFPVRYDQTRTKVIQKFPYMIHFIVDEENERIIITAVFHTKRSPNVWRRKQR